MLVGVVLSTGSVTEIKRASPQAYLLSCLKKSWVSSSLDVSQVLNAGAPAAFRAAAHQEHCWSTSKQLKPSGAGQPFREVSTTNHKKKIVPFFFFSQVILPPYPSLICTVSPHFQFSTPSFPTLYSYAIFSPASPHHGFHRVWGNSHVSVLSHQLKGSSPSQL